MKLRTLMFCAPLTVAITFVVTFFSAGIASAQESPPSSNELPPPDSQAKPDNARFRGGIALEGGGIIVPNLVNTAVVGLQAQLGVQINNRVGVYLAPSLGGAVFGGLKGINLSTALMVDFTPIPMITIGAGLDLGTFVGNYDIISGTSDGGSFMGGRLHFGFNPVIAGSVSNPSRRRALVIGLDARLLGGSVDYYDWVDPTRSGSHSGFIFAPQLTVGYQAF